MARKKKSVTEIKGQVFVTADTHKQLAADLVAVLRNYKQRLHPLETLAVVAHTLGSVMALVDDRNIKSGLALETVQRNMDAGNEEAHLYADPLNVLRKENHNVPDETLTDVWGPVNTDPQ